jgi:asparagine synthase (glutamine-hydrolysing)
VLAHRRLSIVDLEMGWQPLSDGGGKTWIVYNGELYNHGILRVDLEKLGHRFDTRSDTETVVHAYQEWGTDCFARFNGIFAVALWDVRRRKLVLARDPLGVKPLYFGVAGSQWWFASEVKAAIAAGLVQPAMEEKALGQYLTYRFVPSPLTLFAGVERVPPGHLVEGRFEDRRWRSPVRFAPLPPETLYGLKTADYVAQLTEATSRAVQGQLMSDVPVGALLSGGLDSSIIVAAMREHSRGDIATYGIGFTDTGSNGELEHGQRAADALGVQFVPVPVTRAEYLHAWGETVGELEEPMANAGHVLLSLLTRRVSRDLKVVLTGQGADEPLGGYLRHSAERWHRLFGAAGISVVLRGAARVMRSNEALNRLATVASASGVVERILSAFQVFDSKQRTALTRGSDSSTFQAVAEPIRYWIQGTESLDDVNRLLYVDARLSLADDLLLGGDKVTMASSVEARVPYLDLDYLRLAEAIPGNVKISWHSGRKNLQRLVGRRLLPPVLRDGLTGHGAGWGRKLGFSVPIRTWLQPPFMQRIEDFLLGPDARLPVCLDRRALGSLIAEHRQGRIDHTRRITALIALEAWQRRFLSSVEAPLAELAVHA